MPWEKSITNQKLHLKNAAVIPPEQANKIHETIYCLVRSIPHVVYCDARITYFWSINLKKKNKTKKNSNVRKINDITQFFFWGIALQRRVKIHPRLWMYTVRAAVQGQGCKKVCRLAFMLVVWNLYECVRKNVGTSLYVRLNLEHIFCDFSWLITEVNLVEKSFIKNDYVINKKFTALSIARDLFIKKSIIVYPYLLGTQQ